MQIWSYLVDQSHDENLTNQIMDLPLTPEDWRSSEEHNIIIRDTNSKLLILT